MTMTVIMNQGPIPALPNNTTFTYLAEGAMNVVYRIHVPYPPSPGTSILEEYGDGTPPPTIIDVCNEKEASKRMDLTVFDNKLLRLRKDLPHAVPCAILQSNFTRLIVPLFEPNQIVNQCLVKLQPSNVIQHLNEELKNLEVIKPKSGSILTFDPRPIKRRGTYLANDEYGLLVDDMTTIMSLNTLEFKPKWLAQSPSAPENSKRCRQCAYVALQNAAKARVGEPLLKSFCPLDLVSDKQEDIFRVAEILLQPAGQHEVAEFVAWISSTKLLRRLRDNQIRLDALGPLNADPKDERFRAAMTLRDVTVYLRYPRGDMPSANARVGDLDIKSPEKGALWKEKEMALIDEGWYLATEKERQPLVCSLSRGQDL